MQGYKSANELKQGVKGITKKVGIAALLGGSGYAGYKIGKSIIP